MEISLHCVCRIDDGVDVLDDEPCVDAFSTIVSIESLSHVLNCYFLLSSWIVLVCCVIPTWFSSSDVS